MRRGGWNATGEARGAVRASTVLPHPPRDSRTFPTESGKAVFTVSPIEVLHVPEGRLLLQTVRLGAPRDLTPPALVYRHAC